MATVASLSRLSSAVASSAAADSVRHDDTRMSDARTPVTHVHAGADITSGAIPTARIPNVTAPPSTITFASTITPNSANSNNFKIAATGSFTLAVPTNPTDAQMIVFDIRASAACTVTIASGILLTTGLTASLVITSGKSGFIGLRYSLAASAWYLLASSAEL